MSQLRFACIWGSKSEILELHNLLELSCRAVACAPGEEGAGPTVLAWYRDLWDALDIKSPLPGVLVVEDVLPPQGQNTLQVPAKGLSLVGDRGTLRWNITFAVFSSATP